LPIVAPRRSTGTTVITVVMSSGNITAVPAAWMTRPARSTSKPGATAASSVPLTNNPIAVANAARVVTRCRNQPVTGMTTAMVSMNPVDSHCAARALTSSTSMSRGMALTMIVSLSTTTNAATVSARTMTRSRAHSRVSSGIRLISSDVLDRLDQGTDRKSSAGQHQDGAVPAGWWLEGRGRHVQTHPGDEPAGRVCDEPVDLPAGEHQVRTDQPRAAAGEPADQLGRHGIRRVGDDPERPAGERHPE